MTVKLLIKGDKMSENKRNWINIGIGAFIIIAILLLVFGGILGA